MSGRLYFSALICASLAAGFAQLGCLAGANAQALSDAQAQELKRHIAAAERAQVEVDPKGTLFECNSGLRIDPKSRKLLGLAADACRDLENFDQAMKFANQLVALDPQDIAGHRVRMRLYTFRNDRKLSKQELNDLLSMSRCKNITAADYENRASRFKLSYPELALADLKAARKLGTENEEHSLMVEALACEKLGKHKEAVAIYTKLIKDYPLGNHLRRRAKAYGRWNKLDLQKADLEEAERVHRGLYNGAPFRSKSHK